MYKINSGQIALIRDTSFNLIELNDMELIPEPRNLFQCFSTLLFQTDMFQQQISTLCLQYFKQHYNKQTNDVGSFAEYIINQQAEQFEYLNLELISQVFKVKVELYYVEDGLLSVIINHGFTRTIRIFKEDYNYYELHTISYRKKFKFIKKIIDQAINTFLQLSPSKTYKRPVSVTESQKLHPTLEVVFNMNELGVQSAQTFKPPLKLCQTLTPQLQKIVNQQNLSAKLSNGPISTQANKVRVFDYSEYGVKKIAEQIQEEKEEADFLKKIMQPTPPPQQQPQQQIIASQPERVIGQLKFYDDRKQFGFFIDDVNKKDIFVHQDDLQRSGIDPDLYKKKKKGFLPYFSYKVVLYQGKKQQNIKAIEIRFEKWEAVAK